MIIAITGTIGAGKGEIVRILRRYGFTHYGFGDIVRSELKKQDISPSATAMGDYADNMREKNGADYFAKLLIARYEKEKPRNAVFESVRTLAELRALKRLPNLILLSVDAPREIRYERTASRGRGDGLENFEAFCEYDDRTLDGVEGKQQILDVMDEADLKVVNIGNLDELEAHLREELKL